MTSASSVRGRRRTAPVDADAARVRAAEQRIATVTRVLDELIEIPGTRQRVGLDAVVGLIPGAGDLVSALVGAWIVLEAGRFRMPRVVIARMVLNVVADFIVGAVPILGDLFDIVFRSNRRNLQLFRQYAADPGAGTGQHRAFLVGLLLIVVGVLGLLVAAIGRLLSIEIPAP